ncbi:hypothetical protein BDW22DRAFT_1352608 [Trametopsis cervina]|nr:hypothetical protein BDW22DRAFT_1352608 [Trametopsis cervina]
MAPIPPIHTDESLDTSATDSTVDTIAASVTTSDSEFPSAYDHKHTDIATASEAHVSGYIHTTTADDIVDITAHDVSASDEKSDSADFLDAVQQQLEDGDVTLDRMVQLEDGDVTPDRMVQLMIEAYVLSSVQTQQGAGMTLSRK